MSATYAVNPFAPDYLGGLNQPSRADVLYEDRPFKYVYNPPNNQLTASQLILNDSKAIDPDADFIVLAWYISLFTGAFQVQITDSTGYQLSTGFENSGAISKSSSDPTIWCPAHPFPAGGKILVSLQDLSVATNPLQIVFLGMKRFRVKL